MQQDEFNSVAVVSFFSRALSTSTANINMLERGASA